MLVEPTYGQEFILDPDASKYAIERVLGQQRNDQKEHSISYYSKTLNKAEINYTQTEKEALAVVETVEFNRHILLEQKFRVKTDHEALKWLLTTKEPKGRLARWILKFQEYDYVIEHWSGKKHVNVDAMTRAPITATEEQMEARLQ